MEIISGVITIINISLIILLYCTVEKQIKHKNEIISKQEEEIKALVEELNQSFAETKNIKKRLDDTLEKFDKYKKDTTSKDEPNKVVKRTRKTVTKEKK